MAHAITIQAGYIHRLIASAFHQFEIFASSTSLFAHKSAHYAQRILLALQLHLQKSQSLLDLRSKMLSTLSPLHTLARGYSIVFVNGTKRIIRDANDVAVGEDITVRLSRGQLRSEVKEKLK